MIIKTAGSHDPAVFVFSKMTGFGVFEIHAIDITFKGLTRSIQPDYVLTKVHSTDIHICNDCMQ